MNQPRPFDVSRDAVLGRLLREHLDPGGHEAFVARVLAAARAGEAPGGAGPWDLLGRWAVPGIAAAALLAAGLALGFDFRGGVLEPVPAIEAITPAGVPSGFVVSPSPPGPEVVLASLLEAE